MTPANLPGDTLHSRIHLSDAEATEQLGQRLARAMPGGLGGWMVLLQGELGAGKSTLARALLRELGFTGNIPSPTYTLVEPYEVAGGTVYHVDLYRIADEDELPFLGWGDLRHGLMLIEWPERVPALRDHADIAVSLEYAAEGRTATLTALSTRAAGLPALVPTGASAQRGPVIP